MWITAVVTVVVVAVNLVYAVGVGLVMAALRYAWDSSQEFSIVGQKLSGARVYVIKGKLFFATSMRFHTAFDYENDPTEVELQLDSAPADYSASTALSKVITLYKKQGKECKI